MTNNQELLINLVQLWHATRAWAEELLRRCLELESAADVLKPENRGRKAIKGTNWIYRTHGAGVDIYKTEESGGIDFDFDKPEPDTWRMKTFFKRQYNEGNLNFSTYRHLFEDEELLNKELAELLEPETNIKLDQSAVKPPNLKPLSEENNDPRPPILLHKRSCTRDP